MQAVDSLQHSVEGLGPHNDQRLAIAATQLPSQTEYPAAEILSTSIKTPTNGSNPIYRNLKACF